MSCSSRRSAPSAVAGVDGADPAGMAGAPGFEELERFGAAHFANRDSVGPQAQRRAHEIGEGGDAILGAQRDEIGRRALQFAGVLDQHHTIGGLGDLGEQGIRQGRLAGAGAAGDQDVAALLDGQAKQLGLRRGT
jgi:hypothetical protein